MELETQPKRKSPVFNGAKLWTSPFDQTPKLTTDHVQRWAALPESKLHALEAYKATKYGKHTDYLTKAPDCMQVCNFVGITENEIFKTEVDLWKFAGKLSEARHAPNLPKGIEIRTSILEELEKRKQGGAKMHVLVNVYVIPKRLAYDLNIRVNARVGRCRKRKTSHDKRQEVEVPAKRRVEEEVAAILVENLSDEVMDLSIEEPEIESIRPQMATEDQEDVSNRQPSVGTHPEHSVYAIVEEVRNAKIGAIRQLPAVSYNPAEELNIISKIKLKNSFKLGWDPNHQCRQIRKMPDPQAVQRLICAVKACQTGSARDFLKAKAVLLNPKVKPIFLKIVKFHKKYKHVYSLFMSCLAKWEHRVASKESKKPIKDEKVPAENVSQQNVSLDSGSEGFSQLSQLSFQGIPTVTQALGRNGTIKTKVRSRNALKRQREEARLKSTTSIQGSVPYKPILSTISQMLRLSGIDKLLGSRKNCRGLLRFFKRCVFLGGNHCKLPLKYLMDELSVERMKWIPKIMPKEEALFILAKIAKWVVEDFVCMLLQTVFYVTEKTSGRNQLAFFKKSRWVSITEAVKHKYLKKNELAQVENVKEVNARLRFVPKKNGGVRPICAFTKQYKQNIGMERTKFKDSMMLLKYLASKFAPLSSLDTNHFYILWKNFVSDWKAVGCPKLYYLKTDIANAYPSVNLQLLRKILTDFGAKVGKLWVESYKRENDKIKHLNPKWRHSYKDFVVDTLRKKNNYITERPWQAWKYHRYLEFNAKAALKPILDSLNPAFVQLGRKKYAFRQGLLQGSIASQLLCTIYYGYLERQHIGSFFNTKKTEIFLRVVDDYIFVSTEKERVQSLLKLMISTKESSQQQVAEYNLNVEKTKHNLNLSTIDNELDSEIAFWGYRLFLRTGHVGRDYHSYENADICTTVTCNIGDKKQVGREIDFISERMRFLGSLRLAQMMFDRSINCETQVLRNLLNAGCMTAFRLYAMIRILYSDLAALDQNETVMKELFSGIFSFALRLVRFAMKMDEQSSSKSQGLVSNHCCECHSSQNQIVSHEFARRILNRLQKAKKERQLDSAVLQKNKFLLAVIYGMYLKLSRHKTTFRSFLLPKLEDWMKEIIIRLGYNRSNSMFQWLPSELPIEFQKMQK